MLLSCYSIFISIRVFIQEVIVSASMPKQDERQSSVLVFLLPLFKWHITDSLNDIALSNLGQWLPELLIKPGPGAASAVASGNCHLGR